MEQFIGILGKLNWPAILQGVGAIWVALIATLALNQWKKQIKLQKQVDFVDQLTDEIHKFILASPPVVSAIKFTKIGFESYTDIDRKYKGIKNNGAISFIEQHGKEESVKLIGQIEGLRKTISKIRSLSSKGQMYNIKNYDNAKSAIKIIDHVYGQMEAFSYFIGNTNLNWEHPDVQNTLNKIVQMDEELISQNLAQQNIDYLKFAQSLYKRI